MIELYKILTGLYDKNLEFNLELSQQLSTRGNSFKLNKKHVKHDLRKYFFVNRVVEVWNCLPDYIVNTNSLDLFKRKLDKFWESQEIKFNWNAEIHGLGSRSF